MEFLQSFARSHFTEKAGMVSRNVGCFARIKQTPTDFIRDFFAAVTIMVSSTHFGEEVCALRGKWVLIDKTQKLRSQSRSSARKRALYLTIIVLQRSKDSFLPQTKQSYPYVTYFIYKPWQDCTLQGCISASLPSHFFPPPLGAGLSHVLNRYCSPTPHDLLQGSHSCHSLQFPLTLNRKKKYSWEKRNLNTRLFTCSLSLTKWTTVHQFITAEKANSIYMKI